MRVRIHSLLTFLLIGSLCLFDSASVGKFVLLLFVFISADLPCRAQLVDYDVIEKRSGHEYAEGFACERRGQNDEALKWFTKAIESRPEQMNSYMDRANVLMKLKKYREALADVEKYSQLLDQTAYREDKGFLASVARMKAKAQEGMGQKEQALKNYKESISLDDTVYAHAELGALYKRQGKKDLAIQELEIAKKRMHPTGGWSSEGAWGETETEVNRNLQELSQVSKGRNKLSFFKSPKDAILLRILYI